MTQTRQGRSSRMVHSIMEVVECCLVLWKQQNGAQYYGSSRIVHSVMEAVELCIVLWKQQNGAYYYGSSRMVHSFMEAVEWCIMLWKQQNGAQYHIHKGGNGTNKANEETVCQVYRQTARNCESLPHKPSSIKSVIWQFITDFLHSLSDFMQWK